MPIQWMPSTPKINTPQKPLGQAIVQAQNTTAVAANTAPQSNATVGNIDPNQLAYMPPVNQASVQSGVLQKGMGAGATANPNHAVNIRLKNLAKTAFPRQIESLYQHPQFKEVYTFVMRNVGDIERNGQQWDVLKQVKLFTEAFQMVKKFDLEKQFTSPQEKRALAHLLLLLMPESMRTERPMGPDGTRMPAQLLFNPFPNEIITRSYNDFAINKGDLPTIASAWNQHLQHPVNGRAVVSEKIFAKGQEGTFLIDKKYCPGAFLQDRADINPASMPKTQQVGHEGQALFVKIKDIVEVNGKKMVQVYVPEQHRYHMGNDGNCYRGEQVLGKIESVVGKDGKPILDKNGKEQPILVPMEHMEAYLFDRGTGSGVRGLNLDKAEDRAIALTFSHELKQKRYADSKGNNKTLFAWLETSDLSVLNPEDRQKLLFELQQTAWQSVARYTCHPRRTHFRLDISQDAWQKEAYQMLMQTGIMQDCGNRYEKDKSDQKADVHQLAWTEHFLEGGFVGGSLDCLGQADAYDKLCATFLAPLGILHATDLAEGHGSTLLRTLQAPDAQGIIQVGMPKKVKLNEMLAGVDVTVSSGRGPSAQYMENWPGYLKIESPPEKQLNRQYRWEKA